MVRTRNLAMAPLWLLVVAAIVLLALFVQARPVVAPVRTLLPGTPASATVAPESGPNPVLQRPISVSKPVTLASPGTVTGQPAPPQPTQAPGYSTCPTQPGSGLPCSHP